VDRPERRIDLYARRLDQLARRDGALVVYLLRALLEQRKEPPGQTSGGDALAVLRRRYLDPSVAG
jgi:hypothetical protein